MILGKTLVEWSRNLRVMSEEGLKIEQHFMWATASAFMSWRPRVSGCNEV